MKCELCSTGTVYVRFGKQSLCLNCYNAMMARDLDIKLSKLPKTFTAADANGIQRIFKVELQIMTTLILLTARERWEQGYEFAVDGELDADQLQLFKQLTEKTARGLSETYLETTKFLSGEDSISVKQHHFQGTLAYDTNNPQAPLVIIDGKPYSWDEVGRLVQAFEGYQLKMVMKDLADEFE